MEEFETVLIHMSDRNDQYVDYVIDSVALYRKAQFAIHLIFYPEQDYTSALCKLDYWEKVVQVFFEKTKGSMDSNLTFSVIFGKFCVITPPLNYLNRCIDSCLIDVVSSISPPGAKIAYVATGPKLPFLLLKEGTCNLSVTYFAPKKVLDKLESSQLSGKECSTDLNNDDVDDDAICSNEEADELNIVRGENVVEGQGEPSFLDDNLIAHKMMEKQSSTSKTTYTVK